MSDTEPAATAPTVDWPGLLRPLGARFTDDGRLQDFGDRDAELHTVLGDGGVIPLTDHGAIRVVGDDAGAFLQAQLSQGVTDQDSAQWRLGALCDPKGRVLGLFRIVRLSTDDFLLLTPTSVIEPLVRRLRMYVLRARVALQDFTPHLGLWACIGSGAAALVEATGTLPQGTGTAVHAGDATVLHLGGEPERFLVCAHARDVPGLLEATVAGSRPVAPAAWTLLGVRAGEPEITAATAEHFVPQQINLDLLGGVSFQKGCYPGQEVVARMHYRGRASRRMFGLTAVPGAVPVAGDRVLTADGTRAGEVVRAAAGPAGTEALAVLRVDFARRQDLRLGEQPAGFAQLPYPVPLPDDGESAADDPAPDA